MDDARNTDNAWLETVATLYHDRDNKIFHKLDLESHDKDILVRWMDVSAPLVLRRLHTKFILEAC